ncbi:DNA-binding transcriptional LysR family regulator [Nocardiopsis arvandica]|uniref:DNA-binding transcriptional LysR family regulator n=1 Tax=Nocardiopsis sinuspersici TaxID=501010 RepID=A0A7Y9XII6_9ACTN|nr:LysR family transcriptional regulator [Nocardiopsis sinuspersici]NYH55085.1 DNA-binding transcriptional LysR family regulator [Nocardiopsis sinuspersici]
MKDGEHPDGSDADALARVLAPRLRMVAAVAATGHITQAAESLGMPQPTLSRALARVQEELGMALVERSGRGVRLTRAGRLLLPHAERALQDLRQGMTELTGAEEGRVALTFLPTLGVEVVPALLRGFRAEHPGVRFSLTQEPWAQSLHRLSAGGADLALTSPLPSGRGLAAATLHTQMLRLVVPEEHPLARGGDRARERGVPGSAAAHEEFILLKPGRGVRHLTDRLNERAGFTPRVAFEADDIATARGLVAAGLGVSVLPARPRGALSGTVELPLRGVDARRPIGVVWPEEGAGGGYEPPAVALFRDYVRRVGPGVIPDMTG